MIRLDWHGGVLKITKCEISPKEFEWLAHMVKRRFWTPQSRKLTKIRNLVASTNVAVVRTFLGIATYYRLFIPYFAEVMASITTLLKKSSIFHWSDDSQRAAKAVLDALEVAVLHLTPTGNKFRLETDASNIGLGLRTLRQK